MEDPMVMLMQTLTKSGVSIPGDVSSIQDLSPEALVSICAQLLNLIDRTASFSTELPDSVADRFRICTDISLAVKNLGYIGDMSYYKFLYPTEEDSYKLVRFLMDRRLETNDEIKASNISVVGNLKKVEDNFAYTSSDCVVKDANETFDMHIQKVEAVLKDLRLSAEISQSSESQVRDYISSGSVGVNNSTRGMDDLGINESSDLSLILASACSNLQGDSNPESNFCITSEDSSSKVRREILELQNQEKMLSEQLHSGSLELHNLDDELELLNAAIEKLLDDEHPAEFYFEQLSRQLLAKRCNNMNLQRQWDDARLPLEKKKLSLINRLYADTPEAEERLQKLEEIELEILSVSSDTKLREEERYKLHTEIDRQPKVASRKSYIQRIKEITKNSRKLETDIQGILKETRELQLESNLIQERLHRAYAVVDEMILRGTKKDPSVRQIYKLLTNIHGMFEQTMEKILVTDRLRREAAEHEKKLEAIAARGMSLEKLQADLNAIKRENEHLENELNRV